MRKALVMVAMAGALAGCAHVSAPACPQSPGAEADVERAVHAFYDALRTDDLAALQRITTPRFYSFDGGARFNGAELVDVIRNARARGVVLEWSVGPLDTQRRCDVAWTAWENVGKAGTPPNVRPTRWLESAVLVHRDGAWKVDFFHSQRAEKP